MRIATVADRLCLIVDGGVVDVEAASGGLFGPDPQGVYERWDEFRAWHATAELPAPVALDSEQLGSPSPRPRQVIAIGVNYRDHAAESGIAAPTTHPPVFTKFASCITGPFGDITLPPEGHTDWEVELVAVIGRHAHHVAEADAWDHVAGLAVGQDISERIVQLAAMPPQFGFGKSFPGFGPVGPWLVTTDEFDNPDDLELGCLINGEQVQRARTSQLIFGVPQLVAYLSAVMPLLPGDVLFTGTPAGVGLGRDPQRWLAPGDELTTYVQDIGEMRHRFVN
jgi:2-keto-4-pentenoate hydratase/2-oxohepta-3-ene-1,7-dioic acid hydratase in catechol pathway